MVWVKERPLGPTNPLLFFLGAFLVFSGFVSIAVAIYRVATGQVGSRTDADSSVELKWFKFNAPAGFVYGLVAIGLVIAVEKFDENQFLHARLRERDREVAERDGEVGRLKNRVASLSSEGIENSFTAAIRGTEAASLFGGRVLAIYDRGAFSSSTIEFRGAVGVAKEKGGTPATGPVKIEKGDRLFLKVAEGDEWTVNVLKVSDTLDLEMVRSAKEP